MRAVQTAERDPQQGRLGGHAPRKATSPTGACRGGRGLVVDTGGRGVMAESGRAERRAGHVRQARGLSTSPTHTRISRSQLAGSASP